MQTAEPAAPEAAVVARRGRRVTRLAPGGVLILLLLAGVWALVELRINVATLIDGAGNAAAFLRRVWPLDVPPLGEIVNETAMTLSVVLLATLMAVVLSLPLAVWAARNTRRGRASHGVARLVIVIARVVPDVILAIVFVRFFGLGALPGVLAMGLHSVGMVAKLYAEAIEQIDHGPVEALRAVGASRGQQLASGVLPQVLPALVAVGLHRFDINLRVSAILGYVGVAGIGMEMAEAFAGLRFSRGIAWAVVLIVLCVLAEWLSGALRRTLLRDTDTLSRHDRHTLRALARRMGLGTPPDGVGASSGGRISPRWTVRRVRRWTGVVTLVAVALWAFLFSDVSQAELNGGLGAVATTLGQFWPPSFGGAASQLWDALGVTIQIGLGATLIGVTLALPAGSLAARNVSPNQTVHRLFRGFVMAIRGLPELVLAVVLVVVVGLGPVAGTLALGVGAIGLLGKLVADSLEEVDPGPAEALRAVGASRMQIYFAATLPQGARAMVGNT
ncbi:MAG: phosphonate ABC transporter, permease protein PhnE, partial [Candidatus Limnocylindria bacterium]